MPVTDERDVESFLNKVDRLISRLPRLRDQRAKREREQEEWRAQLHERIEQEQHERRQWREQQEKFDQLTNDVDQWDKAERVRAYAAAAEAHLSEDGPIEVGSQVDGWLRWMHLVRGSSRPHNEARRATAGPRLECAGLPIYLKTASLARRNGVYSLREQGLGAGWFPPLSAVNRPPPIAPSSPFIFNRLNIWREGCIPGFLGSQRPVGLTSTAFSLTGAL